MIRRRRGVLLAFALTGTTPAACETLREAVADALATNPSYAAAVARQDALFQTVEQARAAGRPTATATVGAGYDRFDYGRGAIATLGASVPIWTGGRVPSAVRAAQGDVAAGAESVRDNGATLIEAVVTLYAVLLFDQRAVSIAEADIVLLERQVGEAKSRFGLGASTRTDVAQLEAQASAARATLADAQGVRATDAAAYRAAVGHPPGTLALPDAPLATLPGTEGQAYARAVAANPVLLSKEQAARASAARIDLARSGGAPSLSLDGSYGYAETLAAGGASGVPRATAAGLTLRLPLLTGGLVRADVAQARANARAARLEVEAARQEAERAAEANWASAVAARASRPTPVARPRPIWRCRACAPNMASGCVRRSISSWRTRACAPRNSPSPGTRATC